MCVSKQFLKFVTGEAKREVSDVVVSYGLQRSGISQQVDFCFPHHIAISLLTLPFSLVDRSRLGLCFELSDQPIYGHNGRVRLGLHQMLDM